MRIKVILPLLYIAFNLIFISILTSNSALSSDDLPFSPGEVLEYKIYASGFTVGYQTIKVSEIRDYKGKKVLVVNGRSKTSPFVSIFYRLDDKWIIFIDMESLLPIRVEKEIVEGRRKGYLIYEIDQLSKEVIIKSKDGKKVKDLKFKNELFDLFSLVYYFRVFPEKFNSEFVFDFLEERAVRTVRFKRESDVKIKVSAISRKRYINAVRIKQVGGIGIKIIVGKDNLRLPLKMIVPSKLPRKKKLDIVFYINSYKPGNGIKNVPAVYRKKLIR